MEKCSLKVCVCVKSEEEEEEEEDVGAVWVWVGGKKEKWSLLTVPTDRERLRVWRGGQTDRQTDGWAVCMYGGGGEGQWREGGWLPVVVVVII